MYDTRIKMLAEQFRTYIENARDAGCFRKDVSFNEFPDYCCGDASYLLAEFLRSKDIETLYVWGEDDTGQTHAWLVVKDDRVSAPSQRFLKIPIELKRILKSYCSDDCNESTVITSYDESEIEDGLIIDITNDQFGGVPVYVGYMDDLHRRFIFRAANDFFELENDRLFGLYQVIVLEG